MTDEKTPNPEQKLDKHDGGAETKAVVDPIVKPKDNAIQQKAEQMTAIKAFRFTGESQQPFGIDMGTGVVVSDKRPQRQTAGEGTPKPADQIGNVQTAADKQVVAGGDKSAPGDNKIDKAPALNQPDKKLDDAEAKLEATAQSLVKENKMSDNEMKIFKADMDNLKDRVTRGEISAAEATGCYEQTNRLMTAEQACVSQHNRILLAENIMYHSSRPHEIDQGQYNTCNVTTAEEHVFTDKPAVAATMIAAAAVEGHWQSDGKTIKVDPGSYWPQYDAEQQRPTPPARSYASQLLNNLMVNDITQRREPPEFYNQIPANRISADPTMGDATHRAAFGDNGERLLDALGNEVHRFGTDGVDLGPVRSPDVYTADVANEVKRLTGDTDVCIANTASDDSKNLVHVSNVEDLKKALETGQMPMIITIDVNNQPWNYNAKEPAWHVVSLTNYDQNTGMVHISNQWGPKNDIDLSIGTLYNATLEYKPPAPPAAASQKPHNTLDYFK